MPNHYHFLLRTTEKRLSSLMRPLNGGYARWYNSKYHRRGYLFQDRFKSVLCQDLDYAAELVRYIHLNPIRAGLASSLVKLKAWKWCGHAFLLGAPQAVGETFQDRTEALRRFSRSSVNAVAAYVKFLELGIDAAVTEHAGELSHKEAFEIAGAVKGWPAVIGDAEFARAAMQRHQVSQWRKHRQEDYAEVMGKLADRVCFQFKIDNDDLFRKGRCNARSAARARFCYLAHHDEHLPYAAVARFLGTTITPVSLLARSVEAGMREGR